MIFGKQFGGKITKGLIERYSQSPNWRDGCFQNYEKATLSADLSKMPGVIYKQLSNRSARQPASPLPVAKLEKEDFMGTSDRIRMVWYGHSALLLNVNGMIILIDPMLGPNTTPIAPIPTRRFSENTLDLIDEFPEIDIVLLSHDHYDHLDYASVMKLQPKVKQWWVALGVKRHLESWGFHPEKVVEFDWWDQKEVSGMDITFTPTRHFSGRGLTDRYKSLWGGWVINSGTEKIWFSGDGGFGSHFEEIGKRLGPFDFGMMECGQYNVDWHDIHLFPEESVKAATLGGVREVMPVHWAGFSLSYQHTWKEPADQFVAACIKAELSYALPQLGEIFEVNKSPNKRWWDDFN